MTDVDPRYPIGPLSLSPEPLDAATRGELVHAIAEAPALLRDAVAGLDDGQLDTPYREGGWTVRQVVHHLPDSHLNAYVRFRWALTEEAPRIKPYDEAAWAELPDARTGPIDPSLDLLEALHLRLDALLRSLEPGDFARPFEHPDFDEPLTLDTLLQIYAWHGRHHAAHVTALREREGWS